MAAAVKSALLQERFQDEAVARQAVTRLLDSKVNEWGGGDCIRPVQGRMGKNEHIVQPTVRTFSDGKRASGQVGHAAKAGLARAEERLSSGRFRVLLKGLKALPGEGCSQRRPLDARLDHPCASSTPGQ